jgi:AraC-like DNA-binding protein
MTQITFNLSLSVILDILSISTAIMLGLLFMTSKTNNRKANFFVGLFLWALSIEVLGAFIDIVESIEKEVFQTSLFTIVFLLLYVNQTLNKKSTMPFLFLFIPGILINFISFEHPFLRYFEYVFNISLLIFILKTVHKHKENVVDFYSNIENKTLSWIKTIIYIFLFFHVLWIIEDIVGLQNEEWTMYFAYTSNVLTFFVIYWIGYNGFSQPEMFMSSLFLSNEKEETFIEVNTSKTATQFLEISKVIQQQQIFTKTDLTLRSLSTQLNIKEKELSKLINNHTQNNFYYFINKFRVAEFKKLLSSPKAKKLSLLGLAEEAGFSSKSTFYSAFKNAEGITPKQYQNQLKKSE